MTVIWPIDQQETSAQFSFRTEIYERPFERMMTHRSGFVDSLILNLAERSPKAEVFITWNARHFKDKSTLKVLTPEEYLVCNCRNQIYDNSLRLSIEKRRLLFWQTDNYF